LDAQKPRPRDNAQIQEKQKTEKKEKRALTFFFVAPQNLISDSVALSWGVGFGSFFGSEFELKKSERVR
jgi:hypothetical protein